MIRPQTNYTLLCDGCPVILNSAGLTVRAVQEVGANRGWLSLGGRDLCPRCQIASYDYPEAADADPPLVGRYRCVGGDAPFAADLSPLLERLGCQAAVEDGPGAVAATDLFTAGQVFLSLEPSHDARLCREGLWSKVVFTMRRRWRRAVVTGRAVFGSWIGM